MLVSVARCGRSHGLSGDLFLDQIWLSPEELHQVEDFVWVGRRDERRPLKLFEARAMGHRIVARFHGVSSREAAQELTNGELKAERERLPDAGPGQAYTFQLVGLRMVDVQGREIGVVKDVLRTGAHPVYVVQGEREMLVPSASPIVRKVDLEAGIITVDLPVGLDEL
jgi:16S rRNA processing protein RimM